MGIHYDYKSTKSAKLMEKQAKREKKLAEKKAKRLAKEGPKLDKEKEKVFYSYIKKSRYKATQLPGYSSYKTIDQ